MVWTYTIILPIYIISVLIVISTWRIRYSPLVILVCTTHHQPIAQPFVIPVYIVTHSINNWVITRSYPKWSSFTTLSRAKFVVIATFIKNYNILQIHLHFGGTFTLTGTVSNTPVWYALFFFWNNTHCEWQHVFLPLHSNSSSPLLFVNEKWTWFQNLTKYYFKIWNYFKIETNYFQNHRELKVNVILHELDKPKVSKYGEPNGEREPNVNQNNHYQYNNVYK